ncbi:MAG: helix-turn-helix domain-containing protein [Acidobacteriia bacterium]|jgi:transcriptional regulator with XRE-family HTH domain|nr:helix-turn-helix domain-containing protein [Terriglobia bacterium]
MPTVGDRIREIREEMQINQEQLANRAGLSKGFLSDVENNKRNIGSENLLKIANVLGASVDYLLRGEAVEPTSSEPVVIPPELSQAAEELELSYAATVELLEAHRSVIARRSNKGLRKFSVEDWKELHKLIKKVFG